MRASLFSVVTTIILLGTSQIGGDDGSSSPALFPRATPESQGLSTKNLQELTGLVRKFVEQDKIVGAELLVIKNRRVVLHEGIGLKDRERKEAMTPGHLFCVRSMTKPVIGVAVQMLIDEGKLSLDDPVAKHLPAFAYDKSKGITVRMLLTHTSGLPLSSSLKGVNYSTLKSMRDIADLTGKRGPEHPPGSGFHYSDDNSDTLGALIMHVTGKPAYVFVEERLLLPLGMKDTTCVVKSNLPLGHRFVPAYSGTAGAWTKFADPNQRPLFQFFLGSQGLYASAQDYARFLAFLMDDGKVGGKQLLRKAALERIMTPAMETKLPTGFDGLKVMYGQHMKLYVDAQGQRHLFGHGGSDGTHAYAWPEKDLIVLYFTQSRGNLTFLEFEEALQRLLLDPPGKVLTVAAKLDPQTVAPLLGLYWSTDVQKPVAVRLYQEKLTVEIPWQALLELKATAHPDRWAARLNPQVSVEFNRDAAGQVTSLALVQRNRKQVLPRLQPEAGLPSVAELLALRRKSLGLDKLKELGIVRLSGTIEKVEPSAKGTFTASFQGWDRLRTEMWFGLYFEKTAVDGGLVWSTNPRQPVQEVTGMLAEQIRLDHPALPVADWSKLFQNMTVLKKIEMEGKAIYVLRCVPREAFARTFYMEAATGQLLSEEHVELVPGLGNVGRRTQYEDYREVSGLHWPFRQQVRYASQLLGRFTQQIQKWEPHAEAPKDGFRLPVK